MQSRPLGRRHADVAGALRHREQVRHRQAEKVEEALAERVVGDRHLRRGVALVGDIVGRIREGHVGEAVDAECALHVFKLRGVAAEQAVVTACGSAWKRDPYGGVIGVRKGPLW
jgi:hypothetical protein